MVDQSDAYAGDSYYLAVNAVIKDRKFVTNLALKETTSQLLLLQSLEFSEGTEVNKAINNKLNDISHALEEKQIS